VEKIESILNPIEYETVEEIVGWVNVYPNDDGTFFISSGFSTEEAAKVWHKDRSVVSCQPIKVTVRREVKAPVERSVRFTLFPNRGWDAAGEDSQMLISNYPVVGTFSWTG
jgi:hypothetical protein